MKKTYMTPNVEKIAFQYRDQVVVASLNNHSCTVNRSYADSVSLQCSTTEVWVSPAPKV